MAARGTRIGLAVSGGPDSLALLLLAAAARPGEVEAATVDHGLRAEAKAEAEAVADLCGRLGIKHQILKVRWADTPEAALPQTAIQERARDQRYRLLGYWAEERGLGALATGHHADDQAETLLMRLARGSGVRGLAAMRPRSVAPGTEMRLIRPLLGWRKAELAALCEAAGIDPAADPSNVDDRFERVRVRRLLADSDWPDPAAIANSARHLGDAEAALDWAARAEWPRHVREKPGAIVVRPEGLPRELIRRIVSRALRKLASEGSDQLRGPELNTLIDSLERDQRSTLRGVLCDGGAEWRFTRAPARNG